MNLMAASERRLGEGRQRRRKRPRAPSSGDAFPRAASEQGCALGGRRLEAQQRRRSTTNAGLRARRDDSWSEEDEAPLGALARRFHPRHLERAPSGTEIVPLDDLASGSFCQRVRRRHDGWDQPGASLDRDARMVPHNHVEVVRSRRDDSWSEDDNAPLVQSCGKVAKSAFAGADSRLLQCGVRSPGEGEQRHRRMRRPPATPMQAAAAGAGESWADDSPGAPFDKVDDRLHALARRGQVPVAAAPVAGRSAPVAAPVTAPDAPLFRDDHRQSGRGDARKAEQLSMAFARRAAGRQQSLQEAFACKEKKRQQFQELLKTPLHASRAPPPELQWRQHVPQQQQLRIQSMPMTPGSADHQDGQEGVETEARRQAAAQLHLANGLLARQEEEGVVHAAPPVQPAWTRGLSMEQRQAVDAAFDTPLLVLAGPGSGKTSFLVARIARAVAEGVRSAGIAAVTYTRKAAFELSVRIRRSRSVPPGQQLPWIGTVHALALRLLREAGAGVASKVASEGERRSVLHGPLRDVLQVFAQTGSLQARAHEVPVEEDAESEGDAGNPGKRGADEQTASALLRVLQQVKQHPQRWAAALEQNASLGEAVARYDREMQLRGLLDVGDVLSAATLLLQNSERARAWAQANVRCLFVDEWQDTDEEQSQFLLSLCTGAQSVTAVGDDDQQIYAWRRGKGQEHAASRQQSAASGPTARFQLMWPAAAALTLGENFRSCSAVVDASAKLIRHNFDRTDKQLRSCRKEADGRVRIVVKDDAHAELVWVSREIYRLRNHNRDDAEETDGVGQEPARAQPKAIRPWGSFAVLLWRANCGHWTCLSNKLEGLGPIH
eukprot:TRINITY_DN41283_c0_g1_i3.p1 TRINITY_DN41283_c0_g1~~TRINITY_DN41283_c0_g1_i3.p1  ORF type:complete len:835 (-),score=167.16 TRINITY_DN41283_c0_g1_i3:1848-4352(-)